MHKVALGFIAGLTFFASIHLLIRFAQGQIQTLKWETLVVGIFALVSGSAAAYFANVQIQQRERDRRSEVEANRLYARARCGYALARFFDFYRYFRQKYLAQDAYGDFSFDYIEPPQDDDIETIAKAAVSFDRENRNVAATLLLRHQIFLSRRMGEGGALADFASGYSAHDRFLPCDRYLEAVEQTECLSRLLAYIRSQDTNRICEKNDVIEWMRRDKAPDATNETQAQYDKLERIIEKRYPE